ncbi:MAG: hypothetical protein RJA25_2545 [Bacteroidota bacterium]|jgi:2',3'-cyclic-nucleotide 2'-phosphodiesterase (5'-nucleotidase family)
MSRIYSKSWLFVAVIFSITACKVLYPKKEQSDLIKVTANIKADTIVKIFYKPYKDSLDKLMKRPLAELENDLTKQLPESSLGNLMADMLKIKTAEYTKQKIDAAIMNYGGIRVPSLSKGILKVENVYMLMPFDNYLVMQVLNGQQLSDFCDSMARMKGWPVSGLSFKIKEGKAINIKVNNEAIDLHKNYNVATNDYLANGGDGMTFLKYIPQIQTGKLFRDAIIEYWTEQAKAGKKISATTENRIMHAE